jgi:phage tail-like protein
VAINNTNRGYVASKFGFELDGEGNVGFLKDVEGGGIKTDVVDYKQGRLQDVWRQIGRLKYEDVSFKVGMGMSKAFYAWVTDFFDRKLVRKNGAIVTADFNYQERARRSFTEALISEIGLPTLEGTGKEPAFLTVKMVPEAMTYETIPEGPKLLPGAKQSSAKQWHTANFAFWIDGYEDAFKRVMKIDALTIKQQILEYPSGHRRAPIRVPGRLEYPNITAYIPAVDAHKLVEQANKRVLTYEAPPQGGMTGALTLMNPKMETLCTISLSGVDIVSAEPQKSESSGETISMVKVMVQCEKMSFEYAAE